jgi:UDP-4-amino-4,6-dideoxy-N-acetyl-beta-L-altrosamine transaminase
MHFIPYGRQDVTDSDIEAVVNTLKSDFLTQGPLVPKFEDKVASYCGANFAVATNSATSALHIACLSLGLGPGDILWTSPITFVASANCGLYCGAKVDFVDIDPDTFNLCPELLKTKLENARANRCLPKIVVAVHMCGQSCDMEAIYELSREYGFSIIEDASHGIGGAYKKKKVGSCQYSDITVFSFHPVKIVTTGEGGMATTNRGDVAETMRRLRSHGITRNPQLMTQESDGTWYYQQIELGFNYRMSDIQAALGINQMNRLNLYVKRRDELARRYERLLNDCPVKTPRQWTNIKSSWHLFVVRLQLEKIGKTRQEIFNLLRRSGVGVNVHYIPVHVQPYYQSMGFSRGDYPNAEKYYSEAITLPLFPKMTENEQDYIVQELQRAIYI